MRGLGFRAHGETDQVGWVDVPDPVAGPGQVKIRVRGASLNRLDRFVVEGIPGVRIALPHILGSDVAGVVDSVGPGVTDLPVGSEVVVNPGLPDGTCEACRAGNEALCSHLEILGEHTQGSVARYVVVPRRNVYPRPERLPFPDAAAVPLVFQTAWRALTTVGEVKPGDRVAVVGAGGGVGTAAIQIAKLLGANVAAVSRSTTKAERAAKLGADGTIIYGPDRPLDRALWDWSNKRGVDVVFDPNGSATLGQSLRAIARGGRVVVIGATSGPSITLDARTLFWRQASIRGSTMATFKEFEEVLGHLAAGRLRPVVDSVHLFEEATDAFHRLDSPDLFGKVIIEMPP